MTKYALLFLIVIHHAANARPATGSVAKLDHRVATVDRTPVWSSEIEEWSSRSGVKTPNKDQERIALDGLIDAIIVDHVADARHIEASATEIDMAIEEVKKSNKLD